MRPSALRGAARLLAAGRVALGVAVLAAPERLTARWLGEQNARLPAVADLARGLAARDIALGIAALQTLADPVAGPRVQLACALADGADVVGTILAREHLPRRGAAATVAVAGLAAFAGAWTARGLARA